MVRAETTVAHPLADTEFTAIVVELPGFRYARLEQFPFGLEATPVDVDGGYEAREERGYVGLGLFEEDSEMCGHLERGVHWSGERSAEHGSNCEMVSGMATKCMDEQRHGLYPGVTEIVYV